MMARHAVPSRWKTGMVEVGPRIFAYVQATGETGISNSGLIVGREAAVAVDALMVPSMTRSLVAAIKKTTRTAGDIKLGVYASWREAERILPNVMRCYLEFRDETHLAMDLARMLDSMERLRGAPSEHACV